MNKPERVIAALTGRTPDKVPYMYNTTMKGIQERIAGHEIGVQTVDGLNINGWIGPPSEKGMIVPSLTTVPEVAGILGMDAIQIQVLPPIYAGKAVCNGSAYVTNGLIDSAETLAAVQMPDPDDNVFLRTVEKMVEMHKGEFAMGVRTRLGAAPTILSVGIDNVAYFYADGDDTLDRTIEMYTDWSRRMNKNLCEMDFDFFWAFDDIAYTASMLVSPEMFRKVFKGHLKKAASAINKPWIFHSDGNYRAVLDDIIDLGASGIHPIEKASMDTRWLKENYGGKLCLIGNVDINYTLSSGTEQEVEDEVRELIGLLGPGGRFIIADSNSIPDGCKAENIIAMAKAVEKHRYIYQEETG